MVTKKKTKNVKKRKPKGKKLSEALEAKEAKRAEEEAQAAADRADAEDADEDDDDLASEPPPAFDADEDDRDEDDEGDVNERDDVDEERSAEADGDDDGDDEDEDDDDDYEYEDDDEDLAAAQMGHQRYVIAGFFGVWILAGYICGQTIALLWSRFAAKDWFVETVPQLAAVPHEGDLVSRASISLLVGALIGAAIVFRYFRKPDVRQWADEVAEQLTHVKWPTRKDVGNNTVVVMVCSAVITAYLTLLDRFWAFVTNLIYTSGT